ncbi:matrixin family metalloprotease [Arthrobacter ginkgonis]|uniref:matrixin family metalloprotease n=1 Tax=Arthrobacter ginkgonis TaxID=1630594 RepID=UPI0031E560C4
MAGAFLVLPLAGCTDPTPTEAPTECSVPARSSQRDLDPEDTPETPWQKDDGQELVVYFETGDLEDRYAGLSTAAVDYWSASPCIQAVAVSACPDDANCVAMVEEGDAGDDGESDGSFRGRDRGTYRTGGRITLHTGLLDRANDNGAMATIVHEMGHALGLVHRLNRQDVMNAYTSDATNPQPDDINFVNLAVIYGTRH